MAKQAVQSFAYSNKDGGMTVVNEDQVFEDDHQIVQFEEEKAKKDGRSSFFRDVADNPFIIRRERPVEQATAAPGEMRRGPGRPRKP